MFAKNIDHWRTIFSGNLVNDDLSIGKLCQFHRLVGPICDFARLDIPSALLNCFWWMSLDNDVDWYWVLRLSCPRCSLQIKHWWDKDYHSTLLFLWLAQKQKKAIIYLQALLLVTEHSTRDRCRKIFSKSLHSGLQNSLTKTLTLWMAQIHQIFPNILILDNCQSHCQWGEPKISHTVAVQGNFWGVQ